MAKIANIQETLGSFPSDASTRGSFSKLKPLRKKKFTGGKKSREMWLTLGERNTAFFHTSTLARKRRNRITGLENE
ncbi:hypothetical protein V2J09_001027 [Rumex salicifolius]